MIGKKPKTMLTKKPKVVAAREIVAKEVYIGKRKNLLLVHNNNSSKQIIMFGNNSKQKMNYDK